MKTFIFIQTNFKNGQSFRKCKVFNEKLSEDEVKDMVLDDEVLVNWEYAEMCMF